MEDSQIAKVLASLHHRERLPDWPQCVDDNTLRQYANRSEALGTIHRQVRRVGLRRQVSLTSEAQAKIRVGDLPSQRWVQRELGLETRPRS